MQIFSFPSLIRSISDMKISNGYNIFLKLPMLNGYFSILKRAIKPKADGTNDHSGQYILERIGLLLRPYLNITHTV